MKPAEHTLIVKIVGQLLLSDMALTYEESEFLDGLMNRYRLEEEARKEVFRDVNVGADPTDAIAQLSPEGRTELISALQEAAEADGVVEPVEADLIAQVRRIVASMA